MDDSKERSGVRGCQDRFATLCYPLHRTGELPRWPPRHAHGRARLHNFSATSASDIVPSWASLDDKYFDLLAWLPLMRANEDKVINR